MGKFTRAINASVSSYNEEMDTFDVVFATETPALQWSYRYGYFEETLEVSKKAIDMTRLDVGAPFLKDHYPRVDNVIGKVERAWIENNAKGEPTGCATIRLSSVESVAEIRQKIKEGILCNVSVGYEVSVYQEEVTKEGERKKFRAIKWQPYEISAVAIPADYKAQTRDKSDEDEQSSTEYIQIENETIENPNNTKGMDKQPTPVPEVENNGLDTAKRAVQINTLCAAHGYDMVFANRHIELGTTPEALGLMILDDIKKKNLTAPMVNDHANSSVKNDNAKTAALTEAKVNGMLLRNRIVEESSLTSSELSDAKKYRDLTAVDLVRLDLRDAGLSIPDTNQEAVKLHYRRITSSMDDFPNLYNLALERAVIEGYKFQEFTWKQFCKITTLEDFLPRRKPKGGLLIGNLKPVSETEEYKNLRLNDVDYKTVELATKGGVVNFSRQMILSDRLGFFLDKGKAAGRAAQRTIETAIYAMLNKAITDNVIANDGAAAPITAERLFNAYNTMAEKSFTLSDNSIEYLDYKASISLSNSANRAVLNQFNNSLLEPIATGEWDAPSRITGELERLIASPRIGKNIVLFANPAINAAIEVAFLNGIDTPYIELNEAFRQDGWEMKIRHDWTADLMDEKAAIALKTP